MANVVNSLQQKEKKRFLKTYGAILEIKSRTHMHILT
jgi:hypothetical protein